MGPLFSAGLVARCLAPMDGAPFVGRKRSTRLDRAPSVDRSTDVHSRLLSYTVARAMVTIAADGGHRRHRLTIVGTRWV